MIYSRNNQISLCKKVNITFSKIRDGTFDPDAARVSRLLQLAFDAALERQQDSESDSSSSDDASSVASSDGKHDGDATRPASGDWIQKTWTWMHASSTEIPR